MPEQKSINEPLIGVHVCTYNRGPYIAGVLASLAKQTYQNFTITIVDDFSETPIQNDPYAMQWVAFLRFRKKAINIVRNPVRLGICKSRNTAVMADKSTDIFVRLDDDSFCEPDYLERLVKVYVDKTNAGEKVGGVGGIVPYPAHPKIYRNSTRIKVFNETICNPDGTFADTKDGEPNPRDHGYMFWEPSGIFPSHHLRSSFLFTRDAWKAAGGFEESLGGTTGFREETAFCFKMLVNGYTLWTDTQAIAWHFSAQGKGRDHAGRDYKEIVESHEAWFKKNMQPVMLQLIKEGIIKTGETKNG